MSADLIFCLNATIPIFALMIIGFFFRRAGLMSREFAAGLNSFVFRVALPVQLFYSLAGRDFYEVWNGGFVAFCFGATLLGILAVAGISRLILGRRDERGEFIQASYRSSASLLGVALAENLYGSAGMMPLMILAAVPLYNIAAVVVLMLCRRDRAGISRKLVSQALLGIVKNPIIAGILAGLFWSLLRLPMPVMLGNTLSALSRVAAPLGLLALGASFELSKAGPVLKYSLFASLIKLLGIGAVFLPLAARLGFRGEMLLAIIIMCVSPTTVTSYVMARELGHEGTLSALTVMFTTLSSAFTLTLWLFIFKTLGMI